MVRVIAWFGSAGLYEGSQYAVHDGRENTFHPGAYLFKQS